MWCVLVVWIDRPDSWLFVRCFDTLARAVEHADSCNRTIEYQERYIVVSAAELRASVWRKEVS